MEFFKRKKAKNKKIQADNKEAQNMREAEEPLKETTTPQIVDEPKAKKRFNLHINYAFSNREKILLYGLLMALLLFGIIYLVLTPGLEAYASLKTQVDEATFQKETMDMAILKIDAQRTTENAYTAKIDIAKDQYLPYKTNDEIDTLCTNLLIESGFKPLTLTISENERRTIVAYGGDLDATDTTTASTDSETSTDSSSSGDLSDENGTTTESADTTATTTDSGSESTGNIQVATVSISAEGDDTALKTLLDRIESDSTLRMVDFSESFETESSTSTDGNAESTTPTVSLTLEIYMANR